MVGDTVEAANLRGLTAAINSHDVGQLLRHVSADIVLTVGDGKSHGGQATLKQLFLGVLAAFPDLRIDVRRTLLLGKRSAVAEWTVTGTNLGRLMLLGHDVVAKPSAERRTATFSALVSFDDVGVISRLELRGDSAAMIAPSVAAEVVSADKAKLEDMARAYTDAWSGGVPEAVSAHYADNGWISINGGPAYQGTASVTGMVAGFMGAFPGMRLSMDSLHVSGNNAVYSWTLTGRNTGPEGTGNSVAFSGYEVWTLDENCRVMESHGYFDSAVYAHQLQHGAG